MGKHIIRVTRWSCRSLFIAYSRLMTVLFALFCAATGMFPKNASAKESTTPATVFKGTAYRASDSTVLSNIRLFLQDCMMPEYGITPDYGVSPWYGVSGNQVADTVRTNAQGTFELQFSETGILSRSITSEPVQEPGKLTRYNSSGCVIIKSGTDSTYTLYLQNTSTAIDRNAPAAGPRTLAARQGNVLQIRIPEYNGRTISATVVNGSGQTVATLASAPDGLLSWNTRDVAKGIYFLQLDMGTSGRSIKLLVR